MNTRFLPLAGAILLSGTAANALTVNTTTDAAALVDALLAPDSGVDVVAGSETLIGSETQQGTYSGFDLPGSPTLTLPDDSVDDRNGRFQHHGKHG